MPELVRRLEAVEKSSVSKEVYERDLKEIRGDIHEIKTSINKLLWGTIGVFFLVVGQIIVLVATRAVS